VKTPIETEIKLRVPSVAKARALLRVHGFRISEPRVFERNLILDDARNTLRERNMLLRVRAAGKAFTCTFKGPEMPGRHKRRKEIEFRVADFDSCIALFAALGFDVSCSYEKYRTEFARGQESGHVTLDETPIGVFMELEGPARWIDRTAKALGFARTAYITDSYRSLYETWCQDNGIEPRDMVFGRKDRRVRSRLGNAF
jgi:adenylate cyclase, class 2